MFRKMIPLAVAIVLVVGCKKKTEDTGGGGGAVAGGTPGGGGTAVGGVGIDSDPSAAYTIKIRAEQASDKTEETETESGTSDITVGGKKETEKEEKKLEYTEHVIDMPAGAAKPTKLTRTYKVAKQQDKQTGTMKSLAYEGKTVAIEKKGGAYEFTIDGKKMNPADSFDLAREFSKGSDDKIDALMPKKAVKIGETWTVEPAALKALAGEIPFGIDAAKSKITGKLTRAYTKDGKQWGVIALDCDLVVNDKTGKGSLTGTVKMNGTLDTAIDGSSREGTMTMNIKMDVTAKEDGTDVKINASMVATKTVKVAK